MKLRALLSTAAALAAIAPGAVMAATPATPPRASKAQLENGAYDFKVLMSAMHSDKIQPEIKDALFLCVYENSMRKISDAVAQVADAQKLDKTDPDKVLGIMAGVCGYKPKPAAATKPSR